MTADGPDGVAEDLRTLSHSRPAGSEAETRARHHVRDRLTALGYAVTEEPFTFDDRALRLGYPALLAVAAVGLALAAAGVIPVLLTVGGAILVGIPVVLATGGGAPPGTRGTRHRSANLTARHPASLGPDGGGAPRDPDLGSSLPGGPPHVVLVAHVDSKSQRLSFLGRTVVAGVAGLGLVVATVAALLGGADGGVATLVARVGAALAALALALTAGVGYGDDSPGALDNASGVAALLALARVLPERLGGRARLTLAVTGAEELGLLGADRWVEAHREVLHRAVVVNLDTVGGRGPILLTGHDRSRGVGSARWMGEIFAEVARAEGIPLVRRIVPFPGGVDSFVFARAGVAAVTLAAGTARSTFCHLHRRSDTVDRVDLKSIARTVDLVASSVDRLLSEASRRSAPPR
jgi:hypothetical protein